MEPWLRYIEHAHYRSPIDAVVPIHGTKRQKKDTIIKALLATKFTNCMRQILS